MLPKKQCNDDGKGGPWEFCRTRDSLHTGLFSASWLGCIYITNKSRDTYLCVHVGILVFCVATSDSTSESKVLKGSSVRQWVAA